MTHAVNAIDNFIPFLCAVPSALFYSHFQILFSNLASEMNKVYLHQFDDPFIPTHLEERAV